MRVGLALAALALAAACHDAPTAPTAPVRVDLSRGWLRASPGEVGMSASALLSAADDASGIPLFRALLVARHGRLVAEDYFGGTDSTTLFDVRSVTKSVVCALTGIALRDGVLPGTATSIAPYLAAVDTLDSADSAVTVRDLLTMTSGYAWDETNGPDYNAWIVADNHVQYLLDRAHAAPSGATFTYNSAAVHTLGVVLEDAAATPLPRYASEHLFGAIGVDTVAWESLDRGTVNGGAGIALRGRDLLKFGQLFLQRGWSGDRSVVPEAWVDEATRPQFAWRRTFGPLSRVTYGMLWWVSDATPAAFYAWGYGGQFVYVVPSRDLVVVATTDWNGLSEVTPQALADQALGVIGNDVVHDHAQRLVRERLRRHLRQPVPVGGRDHDQIAARDHIHELAAVAPGVKRRRRGVGHPPEHPVGDTRQRTEGSPPRELRARGFVHPRFGDDAAVARPATLQEQLPEPEQIAPAQGDPRAAVHGAAVERFPRHGIDADRREQGGGVLRQRHRGRVLERDAERVHRRRIVRERQSGGGRMGTVEQVLHVVVGRDPLVVVVAGVLVPLVSGRHGDEVVHRDGAVGRVQGVGRGQIGSDRCRRAGQDAVAQSDAGERAHHAFGHRPHVEQRRGIRATEVGFRDEPAVARHEQAAEAGDRGGVAGGAQQAGGTHADLGGAGARPALR